MTLARRSQLTLSPISGVLSRNQVTVSPLRSPVASTVTTGDGCQNLSVQPTCVNLDFYSGDDIRLDLVVTDTEDNPVNVSGAVISAHIRRSANAPVLLAEFDGTVSTDETNVVHLHLPASANQGLPKSAVWDAQMTLRGDVTTLAAGRVRVTPDVTWAGGIVGPGARFPQVIQAANPFVDPAALLNCTSFVTLPQCVDITFYEGDDFFINLTCRDALHQPVDMFGGVVRAEIRPSTDSEEVIATFVGEVDATDPSIVRLWLPSSENVEMPREAVWDCQVALLTGTGSVPYITTIVSGSVTVEQEVTRP